MTRIADDIAAARRVPRTPLAVAAVAFTVIGLAGPLMLAAGMDPTPFRWMIAPLWVVVIGGVLLWHRAFRRAIAAARGADASQGEPKTGEG
jgi:hypothetical protein